MEIFLTRVKPILKGTLQDVTPFMLNRHTPLFLRFLNTLADFISFMVGDTMVLIEKVHNQPPIKDERTQASESALKEDQAYYKLDHLGEVIHKNQ
jgi:mannose/fructose/N-acetylgalactosamine-specific phosphotransferase system component IID